MMVYFLTTSIPGKSSLKYFWTMSAYFSSSLISLANSSARSLATMDIVLLLGLTSFRTSSFENACHMYANSG